RGEKWVMIHPAARYWFKAWPAERFASLSDALIEQGLKVVLIGHSDDQGIGDVVQGTAKHKLISLIGQTSLMVLAGLMKRCALFIGNDGGPMHMAVAVGCPVVALFGPTDPMVWGPKGKQTAVLYKGLDCRDCFYPGCFRGESSCMKQISVDEVYEAARRFI
ncbi:MAG: glycosyltransferase family 9 protein, partial [Nitrospirales bacterium]